MFLVESQPMNYWPRPWIRPRPLDISRPRPWHRPRPRPTLRGLDGLDGIGSTLKKIGKKILKAPAKLVKSVGKFVKKHWKKLAVAAAVAISIYSMGSGSGLAARMVSGTKALGAAVKNGAIRAAGAVKGFFVGPAKAASGAWVQPAMSAASKLVAGRRVSELSEEERESYAEGAAAGFLPMNAELQKAMGLGGVNMANLEAEQPQPVGPDEFPPVSRSTYREAGEAEGGGMPSWVLPAAIAGGALLLVMTLKG